MFAFKVSVRAIDCLNIRQKFKKHKNRTHKVSVFIKIMR